MTDEITWIAKKSIVAKSFPRN